MPIKNESNLNNLKIYCHTEEDQTRIVDFIFEESFDYVKVSTWEPDGDEENPGTWGMFVDNFPVDLWYKLVGYLEGEDFFCFDEEIEMDLECDYPQLSLSYP